MKYDIDQLKKAKSVMDDLCAGKDPVSKGNIDPDTVKRTEVAESLQYISDMLSYYIFRNENRAERGKKAVYITPEQIALLKPEGERKISDICNEINSVILENGTKQVQSTWITDWLENAGYLYRNVSGSRVASEKGEALGIRSVFKNGPNGNYYTNYYATGAQEYIFANLSAILSKRSTGVEMRRISYHNLVFPSDKGVSDFIKQYAEKCFIISTGGANSYSNKGYYKAALIYKNHYKVIEKTDLATNSANQSILTGVLDAASLLKNTAEIVIISATPLGFNSPKSINYSLCHEILTILESKKCDISISVCGGRSEQLKAYLNSIQSNGR